MYASYLSAIPFLFWLRLFQNQTFIEHTFFSLKIIYSKNIHKNILEILDQNLINIEVTLLYFSIN